MNEVAEFNPKSELPDEFEYVDLESVVGTEMISHRTETKDSAPSRAQRLAQPGDVFFQTVRPYQKNNYLFSKLDNNYVFSTGYAQMRPNIDTAFLMSFLQTDSFVKIVLDNCTGTSYPAINSSDLSNLEISLPKSFEEQKKVGKTIISIDNLITLHQRKCDETKKLKKFMLQKMFPKKDAKKPEIRFAGFTNDWEQRKLGDWGDFYYGRSCPKWSVTEDATIPCIRYGELYTKFGAKIDRVYSYTNMPPENLRFSKGTEVLIPRVGENPMDYNHCTWLSMKDVAIGEMISVFNTDNNPLFTATMFNATLQNEFAMRVEGGSVTNLYFEKLKNIDVSFPSIREQEMIAAYFENIDNLITLHQRKSFLYFSRINDWEQRKLMEVAEYRNGKAHENEINDDGEYIVVNSKFVSTNGEIRKFSYAQNEPLYENEIAFVLSDVPNGRAIARTFLVDKSGKYTLNQRIAGITPHEDTDPYYLYIKMNRNEYFLKFDDGNKQTNLSIKDVLNYEDMYPSYKEQQKIGMYFQQLDHLITLHRRAYYNKKGGLTNVHNDNQQYYAIL